MANIKAIHRLSLYDPATGDVVLLNRLSTDGGYEKEPIATEVSDGTIFGGYTHTLTAIFFDMPDGARAQLEAWEEAGTELNCVGLSGTGALLWYHPTEMTGFMDSLQTNARDGVSPFQFELTTAVPYADIYTGTNILRAAMKRNDDGRTQYDQTAPYLPKRADVAGSGARFRLLQFGLETLGSPGQVDLRFAFPMPGVSLFVSVGEADVGRFTFNQLAFGGGALDGSEANFGQVIETTTVGMVYNLELSMPADAETVDIYIRTDKAEYTNA